MRYYVFDTQAAAQSAIDSIDARARTIYQAQGYAVDENGAVIGHRAFDGVPMPDACRTTTFDIPLQRLDGKWIARHIENSAAPDFVVDPATGLTVGEFCTQGLTLRVETDDGTWFPRASLGA